MLFPLKRHSISRNNDFPKYKDYKNIKKENNLEIAIFLYLNRLWMLFHRWSEGHRSSQKYEINLDLYFLSFINEYTTLMPDFHSVNAWPLLVFYSRMSLNLTFLNLFWNPSTFTSIFNKIALGFIFSLIC